jgi:hypothetical protein
MGRGFGVAIIVALAMLVQAVAGMTPAMAAAGQTIEICTAHGAKTITVDQAGQPTSPKQAPCPHCDQCLSPALVVATVVPTLAQPVRYAVRAELAPAIFVSATSARGPPRPPSQAPPAFLNV